MRSTIRILLAAAVGAAVVASGGAVFTLATPSPTPAAATQAVAAPKPSPRAAAAPARAAEAPAPAVAAPAPPPVAAPVVEAVEQRASAATERANRSAKRQQQDVVVLRKPAVRAEADAPSRRAEPAPQRPTAKASAPAKPRAAESEPAERKKPERTTAPRKPSLDEQRRIEERLRKIVAVPRTDDDERRTVGRLIDGITRPVLGTCERLPVVGGLACGGGGLLAGVTRSGGLG
ncbi:hypothetical protein ACQPZQ_04905 [Pseudonocardia sp. CA-142604]|uniref:hypothetical protein n=1 Tax=Pseudonocardia sp. CA-142604 TaxID=3240024 RepID=UPI003D8FBE46